ncbi:MAG TPA: HEAT repeat domain-containing protein [Pyrinomonadaceae bacterium]|jgi:HEAT repeat protein|nr:HEAT repeat domain-containing protein [Pyrinomonadaceae bacterium]
MNRQRSRQDSAAQKNAPTENAAASHCVRLGLAAALGTSLALFLPDMPHAQQRSKEPVVKVTGVKCGGGTVSITGDDSLSRAQTWQDAEGFHVVLVNGQAAPAGMSCGVRARRVGNSLELVIPVKLGASVTVEPHGNRLDLVVSGGHGGALNVENFPVERSAEAASNAQASEPREQTPRQVEEPRAQRPAAARRAETATAVAGQTQPSSQPQELQTSQQTTDEPAPNVSVPDNPSPQTAGPAWVPPSDSSGAQTGPAQLNAGEAVGGPLSTFGLPSLLALLALFLLAGAALFAVRRRRASAVDEGVEVELAKNGDERHAEAETQKPFQQFGGDRRKASVTVPFERRVAGRGAEDSASRHLVPNGANGASRNGEQSERGIESKPASMAVQFGAYRIDQEVSRLVEGQPHSIEVLNSRATDDRRAVETSLLKALHAPETDEDGRRRVRTALEDYGFVARMCAALLLGPESFERASSARSLGEMKSARALPFLTEALYDPDPVVRVECVQSLGAMGLPSAIGALLDVARRHPDIPAAVIGPALTACSVESMELSWDSAFESRTFADADEFAAEVAVLGPAEEVEALPEWIEDETLQGALERLQNADVDSRVHSAQQLAQFQVRRAVEALAAMARHDSEPAVRSAAVTSLGLINHESVFAPVIIALADDSREVRAAAARALSRVSFDRADAYVRVIESTDGETLAEVAEACIKAGLSAQAINRLASEDRRQAYEAFSLLSLCAKAGQTQPILDTIECHRDIEVRLACIRLLDISAQPELGERLALIAGNGGVPERVRRAILETVGRVPVPQPSPVEVGVEFGVEFGVE